MSEGPSLGGGGGQYKIRGQIEVTMVLHVALYVAAHVLSLMKVQSYIVNILMFIVIIMLKNANQCCTIYVIASFKCIKNELEIKNDLFFVCLKLPFCSPINTFHK